jgi:hypothetical protein
LWLQVRAGGYVRACVCVCVGVRRFGLRCKTKLLGYRMCVCVCVCVCVWVWVCVCGWGWARAGELRGYTGEAEWCPEASNRGDAKQPISRGDAQAAERARAGRGEDSPLTRSTDLGRNRMRLTALLGDRS